MLWVPQGQEIANVDCTKCPVSRFRGSFALTEFWDLTARFEITGQHRLRLVSAKIRSTVEFNHAFGYVARVFMM